MNLAYQFPELVHHFLKEDVKGYGVFKNFNTIKGEITEVGNEYIKMLESKINEEIKKRAKLFHYVTVRSTASGPERVTLTALTVMISREYCAEGCDWKTLEINLCDCGNPRCWGYVYDNQS